MIPMPFAVALQQAGSADGLSAACGPNGQQSWLCATVYRISGSHEAARTADVLARPLRIALVVVLTWMVLRVLRKVIRRVTVHVGDPERLEPLRRRTGLGALTEIERARRRQRAETVAYVVSNVVSVFVWVMAGLIVLSDLEIDLAPLLAGAGVVTVVIGFGAQTVVRDYLSGLFIVLEDQYGVGDVIDVGGAIGTVEWISLRATRLRDEQGVVWWVPNGEIKRVGNQSQQWARALVDLTIAPGTDLGRARELVDATGDGLWHDERWRSSLLELPEIWGVERHDAAGTVLRVAVRTVPHAQWRVARELRARLHAAFDAAGIPLVATS